MHWTPRRHNQLWPRSPAIMSSLWREERRWTAPATAAGHSSSPWVSEHRQFSNRGNICCVFREEGGYWGLGAGHRPDVSGSEGQADHLQWPGLWPPWTGPHPRRRHPHLRRGIDDASVTRWIQHLEELLFNFQFWWTKQVLAQFIEFQYRQVTRLVTKNFDFLKLFLCAFYPLFRLTFYLFSIFTMK